MTSSPRQSPGMEHLEMEEPMLKQYDELELKREYDQYPWYQKVFVIFRPQWRANAKQFLTLQECSGSLGDLGTFLPLVTALSVTHQIAFGPTLFFAGVFTLGLSTYFEVPIPVQPMKSISAIAIAEKYTQEQIAASGILIAGILFFLSATNLITFVAKFVPFSLVRGIQLGVGLSLLMSGVKSSYSHVTTLSLNKTTHAIIVKRGTDLQWWGADSIVVSIILIVMCLAFMHNRKVPTAIIVFLYGIIVASVTYAQNMDTLNLPSMKFGPDFSDMPSWPSASDFKTAFLKMVLPQLPLTLLNSVIALEQLASDLFPQKYVPASCRRVCFSIGAGDLIFCMLGMLPMCHGAGGLASQYTFGARSNVAMMILGSFKLIVALVFGSTMMLLLRDGIFPACVIGVLVIFAGVHLSIVGVDIDTQKNKGDIVVLMMTAATSLALDTGTGFLVGAFTYLVLKYAVHDPNAYFSLQSKEIPH
ncbi:Sulfate Permease (SulP) Family [Thraustotheca clavata]|uniref:Sulfate Permease (SulP) Family n=1 Tax=Thraustotheca clavata TaxID=74557 RepID=A0A1W0A5R6_9STRA|nr:Sulfate Permease (SulP) Family [Thraustotheca clavata]